MAGVRSPLGLTLLAILASIVALLGARVSAVADQATGGGFRATFTGSVHPQVLPRDRLAPITLRLHARIDPLPGRQPPHLLRLRVEVNRQVRLFAAGLPVCPLAALRASSSSEALRRCGPSLVGTGEFSAHIDLPEQAPFPSQGDVLLFYSHYRGHPALLGHVFGLRPTRTTAVLPITVSTPGANGFGPAFSAQMPAIGQDWGYVTGLDLEISRRYRDRGRLHSFIGASCPAPAGLSRVSFIAARGTYFLDGGRIVHRVLAGACTARK